MEIENFDARSARAMTEYVEYGQELNNVIESIKLEAERGKNRLEWFCRLNYKTIEILRSKLFNVTNHSQTVIEDKSLYHTILW